MYVNCYLVFHAFTTPHLFQRYASVFSATLGGFKTLTDPKKINVKPDRLRVRATRTSATLREALKTLGVEEKKLEEVALLNGRRLHDRIPADTLLKIVERG